MKEVAKEYIDSGVCCIPTNKEKTPARSLLWTKYQEQMSSCDLFYPADNIAMICGKISNNLEILDFDNHFGDAQDIFNDYRSDVDVHNIIEKLPIERTLSGGFHIFFRCDKIQGNQKLAQRLKKDGRPDTIIETRGEGGYVIVAPSTGYTLIQGQLTDIPTITGEERDILISTAKSFNEVIREEIKTPVPHTYSDEKRPGDAFNASSGAQSEAEEALRAAGWVNPFSTRWRRPGKGKGVSATFGGKHKGYFHCFTSNGHPFQDGRAYTPFQVIALLKYNGSFVDFTRELGKRGFGAKQKLSPQMKVIYKTAALANKEGKRIGPSEINQIAEDNNVAVNVASEIVKKAYKDNEDEFDYESKSKIEKAEIFIKRNYKLRQNVISKAAEMKRSGGQWEDMNEDTIFIDMQRNYIDLSKDKLSSLLKSDFVKEYNPFTTYFNNLVGWDGVDRIAKLAGHFKPAGETPFFANMLKKGFARNIKCALEPEYYNRIVIVFSGPEENGKSYFFDWINPFGNLYYTDERIDTSNKDCKFAITENFIYSLQELDDAFKKNSLGALKAIISKRSVKDRLPWGKFKIDFPRCCSFYGSVNEDEFLPKDGNTRWLVFKTIDIDWDYTKLDKTQIWAQAYHIYKNESCELTSEEKQKRNNENKKYEEQTYLDGTIQRYLEPGDNHMSSTEILDILITMTGRSINTQNTSIIGLGKALSKLNFKSQQKNGKRGWLVNQKIM